MPPALEVAPDMVAWSLTAVPAGTEMEVPLWLAPDNEVDMLVGVPVTSISWGDNHEPSYTKAFPLPSTAIQKVEEVQDTESSGFPPASTDALDHPVFESYVKAWPNSSVAIQDEVLTQEIEVSWSLY
jgi:hypothetical protein